MIEWLLSQGEQLPTILVTMLLSLMAGRLLFARREDVQYLKALVSDLRRLDEMHMSSVGKGHERLDRWMDASHADLVKLFEMAHRHVEHAKGTAMEETTP